MSRLIKIGTRESELAVWQASLVKKLLAKNKVVGELVFIKSEGDTDLITPLYAMGVQGVFTRALDNALLAGKIDIAVHSMKDVPVQLAQGIEQAAVLPRASYKDILVANNPDFMENFIAQPIDGKGITIATSSIRRKTQWLYRHPHTTIENLRGNINTRLKKVAQSHWHGGIFAAAGLERINLRPPHAIELDFMLPAPAQGAIMVVCRENDMETKEKCFILNDTPSALCTSIERDFLKTLLGGCSAPISALAEIKKNVLFFKGNILSADGKEMFEVSSEYFLNSNTAYKDAGIAAAKKILAQGAEKIIKVK